MVIALLVDVFIYIYRRWKFSQFNGGEQIAGPRMKRESGCGLKLKRLG